VRGQTGTGVYSICLIEIENSPAVLPPDGTAFTTISTITLTPNPGTRAIPRPSLLPSGMAVFLEIPSALIPLQESLGLAMLQVEKRVRTALKSDLPPVQKLADHLGRYHGKMLRPALVCLFGLITKQQAQPQAAATPAFSIEDDFITLSAVCEMVHLATLVHDDVLDEADERRRTTTINRLTGNEAAIVLGDYVFSAAFGLCASLGDSDTTIRIAQTGMTLCAGELLQLHHRGNLSLDQQTYYELVHRKTGSLIAIACRLGCKHASGSAEQLRHAEAFGAKLGTAFQIQDDLLDLTGDAHAVGKPLGKDLEMGKLTLPVIHHLQTATATGRVTTVKLLEAASAAHDAMVRLTPGSGAPVAKAPSREELVKQLEQTGSITFARQQAQRLVDEAKSALQQWPASPARDLLTLMADAVVTRAV
jgi:octaprenyl-diphosphate synthase